MDSYILVAWCGCPRLNQPLRGLLRIQLTTHSRNDGHAGSSAYFEGRYMGDFQATNGDSRHRAHTHQPGKAIQSDGRFVIGFGGCGKDRANTDVIDNRWINGLNSGFVFNRQAKDFADP